MQTFNKIIQNFLKKFDTWGTCIDKAGRIMAIF